MTNDDLDPVLQELRHARPEPIPSAEVRARHRAELSDALGGRSGRRRTLAWIAAAAAAIVAVGGLSLALSDTTDGEVATGDGTTTSSSASPIADAASSPLESTECGGPLPFDVPVGEGFRGPTPSPATGAEPASEGQLVAHWADDDTEIEVRWPATLRLERGPVPLTAADRTRPDLGILIERGQDSAFDGLGTTYGPIDGPRATFRMAVSAHLVSNGDAPRPVELWGEGMCGAVEITFQASDPGGDVLLAAEVFYEQLIAAGGPLFPDQSTSEPLVAARSTADALEPVTPCEGNPADPTTSEAVDVADTYPSADDALAAHVSSRVLVTDDGPFGHPVTTPTGPTSGFVAITLPDGRVAFRFPDITAYFIAEQLDDGWAISGYEGPTC